MANKKNKPKDTRKSTAETKIGAITKTTREKYTFVIKLEFATRLLAPSITAIEKNCHKVIPDKVISA